MLSRWQLPIIRLSICGLDRLVVNFIAVRKLHSISNQIPLFFLRPNCVRMLVHLSKATLFYTDLWKLVTNMKQKPNRGQFFCTIVTWQLKIQIVLKETFMGILCPMLCAQLIQMLEPMLLGCHAIWLQSESRS